MYMMYPYKKYFVYICKHCIQQHILLVVCTYHGCACKDISFYSVLYILRVHSSIFLS